MKTGTWD